MEADTACAARARLFYQRFPNVRIVRATVTPDNIDALLLEHGPGEVDVLSVDIDGNDLWVWRAITAIEPRLVVIEYNASFGEKRSVSVPHTPGFDRYRSHPSGFYHGASLVALDKVGDEKGYGLVGCDSRGANAFFVRRELLNERVVEVDPEEAFVPLWERAHMPVHEQFLQVAELPLVEI
jgi:hypothetical protein